MSLKSGHYQVISAAYERPAVNRNVREDHSLNPKAVITLPAGVHPHSSWTVKHVKDDLYNLQIAGAPIVDEKGKVWAILLESKDFEWKITAVPQAGKDAYIVELPEGTKGWVVPDDEPETQIAVKPLIVGPSEPPFFPPTQVFIFKPVLVD